MQSHRFTLHAGVITLVVLLVLAGSGRHFWVRSAYRHWLREKEAQGEKFKIADFIPLAPGASENAHFDLLTAASRLRWPASLPSIMPPSLRFVGPGKAVLLRDEQEWEVQDIMFRRQHGVMTASWEVLATELDKLSTPLAEARAALAKPSCNANLDYYQLSGLLLPHLASFRSVGQYLSAAALNDLHQGDLDSALENLLALVASGDTLKEEPLIISQLVRQALQRMAFNATWQALHVPGWNDEQLAALQQAWQAPEFLGSLEKSLSMERAMTIEVVERGRFSSVFSAQPSGLGSVGGLASSASDTNDVVKALGDIGRRTLANLGSGAMEMRWRWFWSYADGLRALQVHQTLIEGTRLSRRSHSCQVGEASIRQAFAQPGFSAEKPEHRAPDSFGQLRHVLSDLASGAESTLKKAATAETLREMAVAAIALERFRLKHGQYPADLRALVPDFLPREPIDFMDGQPLRYRQVDDGRFALYSIGDNGQDDRGDAQPISAQSSVVNWLSARDWVWPQPASQAEIAACEAKLLRRKGTGNPIESLQRTPPPPVANPTNAPSGDQRMRQRYGLRFTNAPVK